MKPSRTLVRALVLAPVLAALLAVASPAQASRCYTVIVFVGGVLQHKTICLP